MIATVYLLLAALTLGAPLPHVPLAPHAATLRIAVVGDTGEGSDRVANGIAKLHARTPLDAVVITGDAFYPCGPSSASDPQWNRVRALSRIGVPLFPVLGNHDFCGKSQPAAQIGATVVPHWQFPARQYVVDSKLAELLMLDTTPYAAARNDDAADALRQTFAAKKTTPWRIAAGHHPIISSGYHGHFPRDQHLRMVTLDPLMRHAQGRSLHLRPRSSPRADRRPSSASHQRRRLRSRPAARPAQTHALPVRSDAPTRLRHRRTGRTFDDHPLLRRRRQRDQ